MESVPTRFIAMWNCADLRINLPDVSEKSHVPLGPVLEITYVGDEEARQQPEKMGYITSV